MKKALLKCAPCDSTPWILVVLVAGSLSTSLWYALSRGQDFNWDQKNYHIGVPFLLSHGTFWTSIDPAGVQSYFNPAFLCVQFVAKQHVSAVTFAILLGAIQSLAFIIAGLICFTLARTASVPRSPVETALLALFGFGLCLMAPVALSEAGTTFIDLATAVPVVGAYALLLQRGNSPAGPAAAGALIGAATALKLTNGVFAIGALAFALAGAECWRQRLRRLPLFCASALILFLVVGGAWQIELWDRFHNPFFPYYNFFHSPDSPAIAVRDDRFLPKSILDFWRYPLYWLVGGSPNQETGSPSAEVVFTDARWVFVVFGGTAFLAALALFPQWRRHKLKDPTTGFFLAFLLSYAIWLAQFGYQRYMAPIDVLCGAAVLFLFLQIPWPRARLLLLSTVAALAWVRLVVPDWGHISFGQDWRAIDPVRLSSDGASLVFLTDKASLYVAASLPTEWRYVGVSDGFDLEAGWDNTFVRQLEQELAKKPELSLKELDRGSLPEGAAAILASYRLVATANCQTLQVAVESFRLCDVERLPK